MATNVNQSTSKTRNMVFEKRDLDYIFLKSPTLVFYQMLFYDFFENKFVSDYMFV